MIKSFKLFEAKSNKKVYKDTSVTQNDYIILFENAIYSNWSEAVYSFLLRDWDKYTEEYHIYENYYIYNSYIFVLTGNKNDDVCYLTKASTTISELRKYIDSKMDELEIAQNKLYNIDL